ncbi:DUF456 domain-containing protein [Paenibacillus sinopodophylli]|uniref:DUF456 domain-containing protein n=1 Tax=Paenibacillus sinopodophylli TaxID=1837342 RepID=UPI00110CCB52|nr:DUF456 domain-containing protein [Paenibacillus sinopodophylli]
MHSLEGRLENLNQLLQQGLNEYSQTEEELINRAKEIAYAYNKTIGDQIKDFYADLVSKSEILMPLRNASILFAANVLDSKSLLIAAGNLKFTMFKENGNTFIKILNGTKPINYQSYRELLVTYLGGASGKWDSNLINRLVNDGLFLYGNKGTKNGVKVSDYTKRSEKLKDTSTQFVDLNAAIKNLSDSKPNVAIKAAKAAISENTIWKDFTGWKGASTITKFGKGFGILGSSLTVIDNGFSTFYNQNTGEWHASPKKVAKFFVDLSVDVGAGAGSMAVGAVVGSFFLPPAGTIVGAAVGAGLNFAANVKVFGDDPKKSLVDYTKDSANKLANDIYDNASKGIDKLSKLFW